MGTKTMNDLVHVVCPRCSAVNRLQHARLNDRPVCGKCHSALFTGKPIEFSQRDFETHLQRSDLPVVVDFWAPWCGPCLTMAPAFERTAANLEPLVRLAKVNTEQETVLATRFNIRSIPTLIAFRGGREIARQTGAMLGADLINWIDRAVR